MVQVQEYPPPAAPQPPDVIPPAPIPVPLTGPPPPREPKSRLGGAVVSLSVIAVGLLGVVDLAGAPIPASAYIAVALTVVGLGLVLAAFYGRARWLIAVGAVLSLALGVVAAVERLDAVDRSVTWQPTSIEQLDGTYRIDIGTAVLDLSALEFAGRNVAVDVAVGVGDLTVIVPPTVDVRAETTVDVGNATVFGESWGGIGQSTHTVTDDGVDGPGGGELVLRATVDVGDVEVHR